MYLLVLIDGHREGTGRRRPIAQIDRLTTLTKLSWSSRMTTSSLPTIDFSPAKSQLSEVMTQVFHGHQPRIVSRHHGKEQMLLVRPDDLMAMLGEHRLDVQAVYDADEVPLRVPDMGVLGVGGEQRHMVGFTRLQIPELDEDEARRLLVESRSKPKV